MGYCIDGGFKAANKVCEGRLILLSFFVCEGYCVSSYARQVTEKRFAAEKVGIQCIRNNDYQVVE